MPQCIYKHTHHMYTLAVSSLEKDSISSSWSNPCEEQRKMNKRIKVSKVLLSPK